MKKTVYVVWDDTYHPAADCEELVDKVFNNEHWELTTTYSARDVLDLAPLPDLVVNFTIGRPEGDADLTLEEQEKFRELVAGGMNTMYIHAGLACIQDNTPIFDIALGRFASHPEAHYPVYCCAIPGVNHPIMNGVEPFCEPDEHYFCKIDLVHAQPFMATVSDVGTEIGGWTQELGKGRVCCITPGHNVPMLAKMEKLLGNAAAWCVREI